MRSAPCARRNQGLPSVGGRASVRRAMKKGSVGRVLKANRALQPRKTGFSRRGVSVAVEGERRLRFTVLEACQSVVPSCGNPGTTWAA